MLQPLPIYMKSNKTPLFTVLGFLVVVFVYWRWFLPFPHVASDLHVTFQEELEAQVSLPYVWGGSGAVGMGEPAALGIWNWPVEIVTGLLGRIGFAHNTINQYFALALFLVVGYWGVDSLLKTYNIRPIARFLASLFYLSNSYIILLIDGGQLSIGLAYMWFPIAYKVVYQSVEGKLAKKVQGGLAIWVLGFLDIRFIYILGILLLLNFVYQKITDWQWTMVSFWKWFSSAMVILCIFVGLNAFWILPAILQRSGNVPSGYQSPTQAAFLDFTQLGHVLFLLQPHWYKNVFGEITELRVEFVLLPIIVFIAPIVRRRNRDVGFWLVVALIGVFLTKGVNDPLGNIYYWLFENLPGFSLFRDSTKFYFLVCLAYSVLFGVAVNGLMKRFEREKKFKKLVVPVIPAILTLYLVALVHPVWLGNMTGTFSPPVYLDKFEEISETMMNDREFGRVLWIPTKAPAGYSSDIHPGIEASRLVQKRPFAIGTVGTYELFNFLREAPFMGELLDIAGVRYIAYPYPDTRREDLKQDNIDYYYAFLDQLTNLPWVEKRISEPPVAVLKTKQNQDHFFLTNNTLVVVGSDDVHNGLSQISEFKLANNAIVFSEEFPSVGQRIEELPDPKFILNNNKLTSDLAVSLIASKQPIFPASYLDFDPDETGWWKRESSDLIRWRSFLQEKYGLDNQDFDYGGGWAIAEGGRELQIEEYPKCEGCVLLARIMESSRGGLIEIYQGDEKVGEVITVDHNPHDKFKSVLTLSGYGEIPDQVFEYERTSLNWAVVGEVSMGEEPLIIKTSGDLNVVNALMVVSGSTWEQSMQKAVETNKGAELYWYGGRNAKDQEKLAFSSNPAQISYTRFSPTHFRVRIEGLQKPTTLAFSETYNDLWRIKPAGGDGGVRSSIPLYSLINGFVVDKDGEYDVYFEPQRYVLPGLYISGATAIIIMGLIALLRRRKDL